VEGEEEREEVLDGEDVPVTDREPERDTEVEEVVDTERLPECDRKGVGETVPCRFKEGEVEGEAESEGEEDGLRVGE